MKRFLALGMAMAMILCSLTGCDTSHKVNAAIQENISTLDNKLANLEVTVGDLYQEGIATDEMKDEVDEKREAGIRDGESLGENRINQLILKLSELNRTDEILKAAADREYQKKLLKEFGL